MHYVNVLLLNAVAEGLLLAIPTWNNLRFTEKSH